MQQLIFYDVISIIALDIFKVFFNQNLLPSVRPCYCSFSFSLSLQEKGEKRERTVQKAASCGLSIHCIGSYWRSYASKSATFSTTMLLFFLLYPFPPNTFICFSIFFLLDKYISFINFVFFIYKSRFCFSMKLKCTSKIALEN